MHTRKFMDLYKLQKFNSSECLKMKDNAKLKRTHMLMSRLLSVTSLYSAPRLKRCNFESSKFLLSDILLVFNVVKTL